MRAAFPRRWAFPTMCSTTRSASARPSSTPSPRATCMARRDTLRGLQPDGEVRRPSRDRAGTGRRRVATGHYIRSRANGPHRALYRPVDADLDQSYFLFATTQAQIDYLRFPLGGLSKPEVRAIAEEWGWRGRQAGQPGHLLRAAGQVFRHHRQAPPRAATPGEIVHIDGRVLGRHEGILRYRSASAGASASPPASRSTWCISTPTMAAWSSAARALETHKIYLRDMNWLGDGPRRTSRPGHGTVRQGALHAPAAPGDPAS